MAKSKKALLKIKKKSKELKEKGKSFSKVLRLKDGDEFRVRPLPTGEDSNFAIQINTFYLGDDGADHKRFPISFTSPSSIDMPCAFTEEYERVVEEEGKSSPAAKNLGLRTKFLLPIIKRKGKSGPESKEIDEEFGQGFMHLTVGQYQSLVEWFLDEEEAGDFSDPIKGYDIKFKRTGSTATNTEYTQKDCKPSKLGSKTYSKEIDLVEEIKKEIPTYEETKEWLKNYLNKGGTKKKLKSSSEGGSKKKVSKKKVVAKKKKRL